MGHDVAPPRSFSELLLGEMETWKKMTGTAAAPAKRAIEVAKVIADHEFSRRVIDAKDSGRLIDCIVSYSEHLATIRMQNDTFHVVEHLIVDHILHELKVMKLEHEFKDRLKQMQRQIDRLPKGGGVKETG